MKLLLCALTALFLLSHDSEAAEPPARNEANVSLRNEVLTAIGKGLAWLKQQQQPSGAFVNPLNPAPSADHPALSALPLLALHYEPTGRGARDFRTTLKQGYAYLRSQVQPDGGIYAKGLSNYNTSVAMTALLNSGEPADEPTLLKARAFVVGQQARGMTKPGLDGGFGYGPTGSSPKRQHPDLDNTLIALEALRTFRTLRPQTEIAAAQDLDWQAAIDFITRTQNLPSHNKMDWASGDAQNKGGFVYYPGFSNAGEMEVEGGKKALRSYGSMTYGGLLSFIYADLQKDDPRIVAAVEWLGKNYTLEENPGMGRQGLYYFYHLTAKGLATAKLQALTTADGKKVDWARELGLKLINLQRGDGTWVNDTARWMETDPVLVTTYSVLTLEIIYRQL